MCSLASGRKDCDILCVAPPAEPLDRLRSNSRLQREREIIISDLARRGLKTSKFVVLSVGELAEATVTSKATTIKL